MTRTCQVKHKSDTIYCITDIPVSGVEGTITATEMLEVIGTVITMEGLNEVFREF